MKFIGRSKELEKLSKSLHSEGMSVSLIYGRRRVGKSELVLESLRRNKAKSLYYECKEVSEKSNVSSLSSILSENFAFPPLAFENIEGVLDYVFRMSLKEKIIFVLDEYPYLRKSVQGMDSLLQSLIDKYREKANLSLVILGSYIEVMKDLLKKENPLYGRVDMVIDLKPMDYHDSSLFYPDYSPEDKARIYAVFGGIPYYNRLIDDSLSPKENIIELVASSGARLEDEVPQILSSQLSKIDNANEVFMALAKGNCRYSDILSRSHVSSGPTLADILEKLIGMEIVGKEGPINDEGNKKKILYRISDNLSLFYYRYIYRNLSIMSIMDKETFYGKYVEDDFESKHVPHIFEDICRQYLIRKNLDREIHPVIEKIGRYYYDDPIEKRNGEFDIVTLDEEGYIFYEVKFSKNPLTPSLIEEEISQVEKTGLKPYRYVFFARNADYRPDDDRVEVIPIEALYE